MNKTKQTIEEIRKAFYLQEIEEEKKASKRYIEYLKARMNNNESLITMNYRDDL